MSSYWETSTGATVWNQNAWFLLGQIFVKWTEYIPRNLIESFFHHWNLSINVTHYIYRQIQAVALKIQFLLNLSLATFFKDILYWLDLQSKQHHLGNIRPYLILLSQEEYK